ncbi:MAG: xanthine dehydrogenase molybdopterin binding subunit, partial [Acetobacteraceae bacterium]
MPKDHGIGASTKRREDIRFLTGRGVYTDDMALHGQTAAVFVRSTVAHGRLLRVDASAALALPGVRGVVLAGDVPGDPLLATFVHDEPVFAGDTVQHIGQVIGLV